VEHRTCAQLGDILRDRVFGPLGMDDSRLSPPAGADPKPGMTTTAADYGRFLAHALGHDDLRWQPLWPIDDELAWGAGWASRSARLDPRMAMGPRRRRQPLRHRLPSTGTGIVVLTDEPDGRTYYRTVIEHEMPGPHPSLHVEHNPTWLDLSQSDIAGFE
jgi:CubicO group peptidase (beta-lactamase class C family)